MYKDLMFYFRPNRNMEKKQKERRQHELCVQCTWYSSFGKICCCGDDGRGKRRIIERMKQTNKPKL